MSQTLRKTETCTCHQCDTTWIRSADGSWWCDPDYGTMGFEDYRFDPLAGGRDFCPCLRSDANGARFKCCITGDIIPNIDLIGPRCPIESLEEDEHD